MINYFRVLQQHHMLTLCCTGAQCSYEHGVFGSQWPASLSRFGILLKFVGGPWLKLESVHLVNMFVWFMTAVGKLLVGY